MIMRIFRAVLCLSCVGSALACVLAALRPLTRRYFSAGWNYYGWVAVLLALLIPVYWPAFNQRAASQTSAPGEATLSNTAASIKDTSLAPSLTTGGMGRGSSVLAGFWLAGVCLALTLKLASYTYLLRLIRRNTKPAACPQLAAYTGRRVAVRVGGLPCAPMVVGLFRPILLLPEGMNEEQLHYILLHEALHIRRHDLLVKWLALAARCVHWFNPLAHWVVRQIDLECEVSCDLALVAHMKKGEEQAYKRTLLELLSRNTTKSIGISAGMAGKNTVIKRRLNRMKDRKPIGKAAAALSACLAALLLCSTLFASGALAAQGRIYETPAAIVLRDGVALDYEQQPFVAEGVTYVPLRETLSHFVDLSQPLSDLSWLGRGA